MVQQQTYTARMISGKKVSLFLYKIYRVKTVLFVLRMLLCAKMTMEDFYVIHHEMGHIEYYMAYQDQPYVFQVCSTLNLNISLQQLKLNIFLGWCKFCFSREYR